MKPFLAFLETFLVLVAAGLLSALLVAAAGITYWVVIENQPLAELGWPGPSSFTAGMLAAVLSIQAVIFGAAAFLMTRWRIRPGNPSSRSSPARSVALGLLAGGAAVLVTIVVSTLMSLAGYEVSEQPWVMALVESSPKSFLFLTPWIVIVAPVAEELFFRGYVFRFLSQQAGAGLGYAASSLMFAVIHFHLPLLGFYLLYGLILAYVYQRTSRLLAPIVAHVTINLVGVSSLLLSGVQIPD